MEFGLAAVWLATYLALGVVALPIAALAFPRFVDRGAGLALPLATLLLWVPAYWVGQVAFAWPALAAGLVTLLGASWLASRRVAYDVRGYAEVATVFAVAFLLLVGLRAVDPAAWPGGGEKFLDYGLLASLLRATSLPPQDFWFAGEPVQYYYGGHLLSALLATLTGTPARHAYNLALAGFYATLVSAAYGLAGAMAAEAGYRRRTAAVAAAVLVGVSGNLSTPLRLAYWLLPDGFAGAVSAAAGVEVDGLALGPLHFDYWLASRVIEGTINEFPFFAFLNGDLHAHMMNTPFLLLAAAVLFGYWQTPGEERTRRRALAFVALPSIAGAVAVTSTWSFPTVGGLAWLTFTFAAARPATLLPRAVESRLPAGDASRPGGRLAAEGGRTALALSLAAAVLALGFAVALPFFTGPASGRSVGFLPDRSGLGELLVVHGAFLAVTAAYLASRLDAPRRTWTAVAGGLGVLAAVAVAVDAAAVAAFVPVLVAGWLALRTGRPVGFETVLVVGVMGLLVLVEFAYVSDGAGPGRFNTVFKTYMQAWVLWATAAGAMLAGTVDGAGGIADVRRDVTDAARRLAGRVRRSGGTAEADGGSRRGTDGRGDRGAGRRGDRGANRRGDAPTGFPRRSVAVVLVVALVASTTLYAPFAAAGTLTTGRDDPTLDALQFVHDHHPEEAAAIEWLADRRGQPHVASAPGTSIYQWVNAPSSLTGLPTVAGWAHEVGYRGEDPYQFRLRDVRILFTGDPGSRAAILERYDVAYVYVGPIEKERYDRPDFRGEPGLYVAHESGNVTIYGVNETAL